MTLELFGDLLSQPTRAVEIFLRANKIDHKFRFIDLPNKQHRSPEFEAINPRGQVPVIIDDGFTLPESATILRYLALTRSVPDHWYPADVKQRARVDTLLDWYHTNLRQTARYIFSKELQHKVFKYPTADEKVIRISQEIMTASMKQLEGNWLNEEGPFLLGSSQPSIADVLFTCEVHQLRILSKPDYEAALGPWPKIRAWLVAVEENLAPHVTNVSSRLDTIAEQLEVIRSQNTQAAL